MAAARILIVEDENLVALDLRTSLERLGYTVVGTAGNGDDAIAGVESLKPNLLLMDIRLKDSFDGITAALRIRERTPVPVVFLTAHSDPLTLERARTVRPAAYLMKPFQIPELTRAIDEALAAEP